MAFTRELKPYHGVKISRSRIDGTYYYGAHVNGEYVSANDLQTLKRKIKNNLDDWNRCGIIIGVLDRFGYNLSCTGHTEEEVKTAIMNEYCEEYVKVNGCSPKEEIYDESSWDDDGRTYYDIALEDIEIQYFRIGEVEWR